MHSFHTYHKWRVLISLLWFTDNCYYALGTHYVLKMISHVKKDATSRITEENNNEPKNSS